LLPPNAIVRLLKVGGISLTRRVLRFLEEEEAATGVDLEFEVILVQTCSSAKCDDEEADDVSATLYFDVTEDIKAKVESGDLTSSIQEQAVALGISELSEVSVSPDSLQVSEAKVTVKEAQEDDDDSVDPPDDDSGSSRIGISLSIAAGFVSMIFLLHI